MFDLLGMKSSFIVFLLCSFIISTLTLPRWRLSCTSDQDCPPSHPDCSEEGNCHCAFDQPCWDQLGGGAPALSFPAPPLPHPPSQQGVIWGQLGGGRVGPALSFPAPTLRYPAPEAPPTSLKGGSYNRPRGDGYARPSWLGHIEEPEQEAPGPSFSKQPPPPPAEKAGFPSFRITLDAEECVSDLKCLVTLVVLIPAACMLLCWLCLLFSKKR